MELVRGALQEAGGPLTAAQLVKAWPGPKKPKAAALLQLLEAEAARGEIFRWEPSSGKTPRFGTSDPVAHARETLRVALAGAKEPATAEQLHKATGKAASAEAFALILEEEVAEGRAFRFEPAAAKGKGKAKPDQPRYWGHGQDHLDRGVMLGVLEKGKGKTKGPLNWSELTKALEKSLPGSTEDQLSELLFGLLEEGKVHKALNFDAKKPDDQRYATQPPDIVALVGEAIAEIRRKFAVAGVAAADVDRAALSFLGGGQRPEVARPAPDNLPAAIMAGFAELKREKFGHTGLVPIFEIRRYVAAKYGPESARHDVLDEAIKGLWRAGRLTLLPLNDATGVSVDEMNDAIKGSNEVWFYLEAKP